MRGRRSALDATALDVPLEMGRYLLQRGSSRAAAAEAPETAVGELALAARFYDEAQATSRAGVQRMPMLSPGGTATRIGPWTISSRMAASASNERQLRRVIGVVQPPGWSASR